MAERGWTGQWALALFALSAALVTGGEEKAATSEKMPGRQFSSRLPLHVWALHEEGGSKLVGATPSKEPLAIPSCLEWWVRPLGQVDMAAVAKEVDGQAIPGLDISGHASNEDLMHLKELRGLRRLELFGTQITDAGVAHLRNLKGLQRLDLGATQITDAGVAHLMELRGLQSLDLTRTRVTDAGLTHLKELKGLRWLGLWHTQVTAAGIAELKKSLPNVRVER
ncbi:MAG: hypothetical protein FJ290_32595 [Planctomycetes bacterium]|nr:hypothetical protein [Planctomycetota bacterium]